MAEKIYNLGTSVKITATLSSPGASRVTMTIKDPGDIIKVNEIVMTASSPTVYYYIYQSNENDSAGEYVAIIKATYGSYTSLDNKIFNLSDTYSIRH
jgi:hypothetical protein